LKNLLGRRPRVKVEPGDAAAAIERIVEGTLVAVGSRGLDAARRFALGSVSMNVLRAVDDGPVLVCSPSGEG
jgi:nucleotide-binding universal stress UspA family protein